MDCSVSQSAVVDYGFMAFTGKPCAAYPRRWEATDVVECNVNQYAVVGCRFVAMEGSRAMYFVRLQL